jgi:hypothetical protein
VFRSHRFVPVLPVTYDVADRGERLMGCVSAQRGVQAAPRVGGSSQTGRVGDPAGGRSA